MMFKLTKTNYRLILAIFLAANFVIGGGFTIAISAGISEGSSLITVMDFIRASLFYIDIVCLVALFFNKVEFFIPLIVTSLIFSLHAAYTHAMIYLTHIDLDYGFSVETMLKDTLFPYLDLLLIYPFIGKQLKAKYA